MVALRYNRRELPTFLSNDDEYEECIEEIYELQIDPDFDMRKEHDRKRLYELVERCRLYEILNSRSPLFQIDERSESDEGSESDETEIESSESEDDDENDED